MSDHPYECSLETSKTYYWCTCGLSQNQPFCDGSHKGSDKKSLPFSIEAENGQPSTQTKWLCGCKNTKNPPYCDGSHSA